MDEVGEIQMNRRSFLKAAGALGALAAAGGTAVATDSLFGEGVPCAHADSEDKVVWGHCAVNCEGRCALQLHVKDDEVYWVESDNTGTDEYGEHQIRACLRGRSIRRWLNHPDRLKYPMKRTGERGSGQFERISWDEAIQTIADNYRRILDTYGPESIYNHYATGVQSQNIRDFVERFMDINGGHLGRYGSYSSAQISASLPYLYGSRDANSNSDIVNSKLVVMFGENSVETKMSGAGAGYHLEQALERGGAKVIIIDPRYSDSAATRADQWIPIRPGTDGALVDALAYVMIAEDSVDHDFLATYCIGYDEGTMPADAPQNASYKSYIMGLGTDKTKKTPEWASAITGIPVDTITDLAHEIAQTKPCAIYQGKGIQRQANGEQASRAICMLAILTGNVGINGGNTGSDLDGYYIKGMSVPHKDNAVKLQIPTFLWTRAIEKGPEMTALSDGIKGGDKLNVPIKLIFNYGGNCLTNQHGDINQTHELLKDDSKCEFIVVWDTFMTDSAKYADILLPDLMPQEQPSFAANDYAGNMGYVIMGQPATSAKYERRTLYATLTDIADKLGKKEEFTEGRDEAGWLEYMYEQARVKDAQLPEYAAMVKQGVYRRKDPDGQKVAFKAFRKDPAANPLKTDSGKIEIYSSKLAKIASTWKLDKGDIISPLPVYAAAVEGWEDSKTSKYPLQMPGYHYKARAHSSYGCIDVLQQANRQQVWINPADAQSRGIADGDTVHVYNDRGTLEVEAKVTERILPGVVSMGQGAWFNQQDGIDKGACFNTIASSRPSPLAKANPSHTNLVEVAKA